MITIDTCLSRLHPLIRDGHLDGMPVAEKRIDEFVNAHDGAIAQTGALHALEQRLEAVAETATGPSLEFVDLLIDRSRSQVRHLRDAL